MGNSDRHTSRSVRVRTETNAAGASRSAVALPALVSMSLLGMAVAGYSTAVHAQAQTQKQADAVVQFDIPAQPLSSALLMYGTQAQLTIAFPEEYTAGFNSTALSGAHGRSAALSALLKGTNLQFEFTDAATVKIFRAAAPADDGRRSPAAAPAVSGAAAAGSPDDGIAVEEVIVTARRREERLQDVPISVTAFGAEALEAASMSNLKQVGELAPNVAFSAGASGSSNAAAVYIRGIGEDDYIISSDPRIGVYVDGVYLARSMGALMDLLDLERIEVLRGPQGTLFGKNTMGGAVNIVSSKPDGTFGGEVKLTGGSRSRFDAATNVRFPIIEDRLSGKIAIASNKQDGYGRRILTGEDLGDENSFVGRGMLRWTPSDDIEVLWSVDGTRQRENSIPHSLLHVDTTRTVPRLWNQWVVPNVPGTQPAGDQWVPGNKLNTYATGPNASDLDTLGTSLTATWQLPGLTLKSLSAYRRMRSHFAWDVDGSPARISENEGRDRQSQFSQEFQFLGDSFDDRLSWIVGLYGLVESAEAVADFDAATELSSVLGFNFDVIDTLEADNDSYAAYGQGTWRFTDRLSMTGGLRLTRESKEGTVDSRNPSGGTVNVDHKSIDGSWQAWTPRLGFEYKLTSDVLLFTSAARGFKSGGFNGRPFAEAGLQTYDPEYVWTYDVGIKSDWFDRRLRLNATAFYSDFDDMQLTVVTTDANGLLTVLVDNAGQNRLYGLELESIAHLATGLEVFANVGYLHNEFVKISGGATEVTLKSKLEQAPEWTANAGFQYTVPTEIGTVQLRGDWIYRSEYFNNPQNSPLIAQDGYEMVNARLAFRTSNDVWEFAVFGRNLTNEVIKSWGIASTFTGSNTAFWGEPREWGVSVKANF